ncbi:hypothetical protein [Burkholderia sp. S171]|uniref:hypothetical protein n=1 Tax=Burkholderia sp. S171 TaxID=1641860 RepID=UPI00131B7150|nr:hypothetical protein [Burkholderia sp. S171]
MKNLNAIMALCFKRRDHKSADGYFCFTLEHGAGGQTLLMRLMQCMLSSAQCLAGGPLEFFFECAKQARGVVHRGLKPPIVGCLKIDSELFHQLGALTNAVAPERRLTRWYRLMGGMSPCSAWASRYAGRKLKTLR